MAALAQSVHGELLSSSKSGALVMDPSHSKVLLRYALPLLGTDELVFPELALDDWGHERKKLHLYRWIYENGYQFPRAELFGYDINGHEQQYFLRELDLQSKYPCFGYAENDTPLSEGIELSFMVVVREDSSQAELLEAGSEIDWPMRNAAVDWWQDTLGGAIKLAESLLMRKNAASFE